MGIENFCLTTKYATGAIVYRFLSLKSSRLGLDPAFPEAIDAPRLSIEVLGQDPAYGHCIGRSSEPTVKRVYTPPEPTIPARVGRGQPRSKGCERRTRISRPNMRDSPPSL